MGNADYKASETAEKSKFCGDSDIYCDCMHLNRFPLDGVKEKPEGVEHLGIAKKGYICPACKKYIQVG